MTVPTFKPSIRRSDMQAVLSCLVTDTIGPGQLSKKLATAVANFLGIAGGIALREYNRGIGIALDSLELEEGSKVILSPLSPDVYRKILVEKEFTVLYADVDEENGCINPASVESLLSLDPKALIVHCPLGFIPDMETLSNFDIPIIEDVSQSFGGNTPDKSIGTYGRFVLISLEPNNIITSGGGTLLLCRNRNDFQKVKNRSVDIPQEAFLSDMNAALGLVQFNQMEDYITARREIAKVFSKAMMRSKHKTMFQQDDSENIYYSFPVFLNTGMKDVVQYAKKKNIHTLPAFLGSAIENYQLDEMPCPVARSLLLRSLLFPLYPGLGKSTIETIAKVLSTLP